MLTQNERETIKQATTLIVRETQAGEDVILRGFGTFKRIEREAKAGRNPKTGDALQIPARSTLHFKPSAQQVVVAPQAPPAPPVKAAAKAPAKGK